MKHNLGLNRVNFRILGWHKAMVLSQTRQRSDQRDLDTLRGESIGVAGSVTLDKSVPPEFAQVIAELIETVTFIGEMEGGEDLKVPLIFRGNGVIKESWMRRFFAKRTRNEHQMEISA